MRVLLRILEWTSRCPTSSDEKYRLAMITSGEVLELISAKAGDPARDMVADIFANRDNVPYLTTAYEALQEMNAPVKQRA